MKQLMNSVTDGKPRPGLKPEERLLLAIVESAFWDLQSGDPPRRNTARRYFLDDGAEAPFSFAAICEHFSWSADSIRGRLHPLLSGVAALHGE